MKNQFLIYGEKDSVGKPMTDLLFDSELPSSLQKLSPYQWTPVSIVKRTWEFLKGEEVRSIMDLGSGLGKFCIVLSFLAEDQFPIYGCEDREELLQMATSLQMKWKRKSVCFQKTNFLTSFPYGHSHYYCFNPLYETMKGSHSIDDTKVKSAKLFLQNIQTLKNHLYLCPKGTKLITYHGFGGSVLPGYIVIRKENDNLGEWMVWERV